MYREIPADSADLREILVETPLDDYELLDFGKGRKLERFGKYILDRPDPRAQGTPMLGDWQADWVFTEGRGGYGEWRPAYVGLSRQWQVTIDGMSARCVIGERAQIGVQPRDIACRRWIRERLQGCYDIDDLSALILFAGTGVTTDAAIQADATVTASW